MPRKRPLTDVALARQRQALQEKIDALLRQDREAAREQRALAKEQRDARAKAIGDLALKAGLGSWEDGALEKAFLALATSVRRDDDDA